MRPIIDEIDRVLAKHYGFPASGGSTCGGTDPALRRYAVASEELDFPPRRAGIINYDIKYRMGRDTGEDEE